MQTNSANIGFNLVTKYPQANCVCIDEMELRYAAHDRFSDVRTLKEDLCANRLRTYYRHPWVARFAMLFAKEGFHETPAFAYRVVDAVGRGCFLPTWLHVLPPSYRRILFRLSAMPSDHWRYRSSATASRCIWWI